MQSEKIILRAEKFVGSKIMLIFTIIIIYSKFGEIFRSAVHRAGKKVTLFSTDFRRY